MLHKFPKTKREELREAHEAGRRPTRSRSRDPKDFEALCWEAAYRTKDGKYGFPAAGLRSALVNACRLVGVPMTVAKLALFVEADDVDEETGIPLVLLSDDVRPQYTEMAVRNASGVIDLRPRPAWPPGWSAKVRVTYDEDLFAEDEVKALLDRAGQQVGIGEGRPGSPRSPGLGWGRFRVEEN